MTDKQITEQVQRVRIALDVLKTSALHPMNVIATASYCSILTAQVGTLVNLCLAHIADQMLVDDMEETSR